MLWRVFHKHIRSNQNLLDRRIRRQVGSKTSKPVPTTPNMWPHPQGRIGQQTSESRPSTCQMKLPLQSQTGHRLKKQAPNQTPNQPNNTHASPTARSATPNPPRFSAEGVRRLVLREALGGQLQAAGLAGHQARGAARQVGRFVPQAADLWG